jgi:hypothetical protein
LEQRRTDERASMGTKNGRKFPYQRNTDVRGVIVGFNDECVMCNDECVMDNA